MKRKLIGVFLCLIFILTIIPLNAISIDEEIPEITDETDDTLCKHFDIVTVRFFEIEHEPDYLFISIELNDLTNYDLGALYMVEWTSSSGRWASASILGTRMDNEWRCGDYSKGGNIQFQDLPQCDGSIDKSNNIITWIIPKDQVGNPKSGDVLTKTQAVSCLSGYYLFLLTFRDIPKFHDNAPDEGYGLDYTIKF